MRQGEERGDQNMAGVMGGGEGRSEWDLSHEGKDRTESSGRQWRGLSDTKHWGTGLPRAGITGER